MKERTGNLLTLAVATLVPLLVLEVASRALVAARTPDGMRFEGEVLYGYAPRTRVGTMVLNDVGCVGDDAASGSATGAGEVRVLLLGGSTSFAPRYVSAVKARLEAAHPGRRFRVMSCGKPRYTSWVNRENLERLGDTWAPDVVVYYEGINDNVYNSFPWLDGLPRVGYFDWRSHRSSVFLDLLRYHLVDKTLRSVPDFAGRPLRSPAIFERNVREIVALARRRNATAVLATFPIALPTADEALQERIQSEESTMRHFWGNVASTVAGVDAHNRVVEALAKELGTPLARVAEVMPRDAAHFRDICHLKDAGNDLLGATIAGAIPVPGETAGHGTGTRAGTS